jgi:hypothetical protein
MPKRTPKRTPRDAKTDAKMDAKPDGGGRQNRRQTALNDVFLTPVKIELTTPNLT